MFTRPLLFALFFTLAACGSVAPPHKEVVPVLPETAGHCLALADAVPPDTVVASAEFLSNIWICHHFARLRAP